MDYVDQLNAVPLTPERKGELIFFAIILAALIGTLGYMVWKPVSNALRLVTFRLRFLSPFNFQWKKLNIWGKYMAYRKQKWREKARAIVEDYITDGLTDCIHQGVITYDQAKVEAHRMATQLGLWGLSRNRYQKPVTPETLEELRDRIILERSQRGLPTRPLNKMEEALGDKLLDDFNASLAQG